MLAPKKVQEQYTSTRTTSKLATHGFLGDEDKSDRLGQTAKTATGDGRRRAASAVHHRENEKKEKERKEKEKKQREKEEKAKAKEKKTQQKKDQTDSAESSSTINSAHDTIESFSTHVEDNVEGKQRRHSAHQVRQVVVSNASSSVTAMSTYEPSVATTVTTLPNAIKKYSSFESSLPTGSSIPSMSSSGFSNPTLDDRSDETLLDRDPDDLPMTVTRTPHAEAFTTLDPNVIEYVRSKTGGRQPVDNNIHWSKRWLPGFARPTKSVTNTPTFPAVPSVAVLDANYNPPWMTIAGRTAQETNERLIQNLNDSFKDVGLVHSKPVKTPVKRKNKTGRNLFGEVPEDALYMLLPLWASETDDASMAEFPQENFENIPVSERQYLLVYYVGFEPKNNKQKAQEHTKKKAKLSSSGSSSFEAPDSKTVFMPAFRVSARLVGYDELRGTGVRLPNTGLSVTGPAWEAVQHAPSLAIRDEHHDDSVVATCMGREQGIQFLPEGLFKLGLSLPVSGLEKHTAHHLELGQMMLSPIGRSVVEMIWLGCMALTSFGAT